MESPDFTQELAWELDKKGLHQHRLQRTSIKVQVYASDPHSTMRETIGYVVLDLRSATNQQVRAEYYVLYTVCILLHWLFLYKSMTQFGFHDLLLCNGCTSFLCTSYSLTEKMHASTIILGY